MSERMMPPDEEGEVVVGATTLSWERFSGTVRYWVDGHEVLLDEWTIALAVALHEKHAPDA